MEKEKLKQREAQLWLIRNDPEAAEFWAGLPEGTDFVNDKAQNIRDFGPDQEEETCHPPYPWCRGNPTREACAAAGYCKRDPNCGE
jgi:hypothetical protein